jgi:hypothetical protein
MKHTLKILTISAAITLTLSATTSSAKTPHTENQATPSQGTTTLTLKPLWNIGDDDEVLLGTIERVLTQDDGSVLLMDSQLSQVLECSSEGDVLRQLGNAGDGPGEITHPQDMVRFSDGTLGLVKVFPGQLVMLTPDGLPAGNIKLVAGEGSGGFITMHRALQNGGTLLLGASTMTMDPNTPHQSRSFFIASYDRDGTLLTEFARKDVAIDLGKGKYEEDWQEYVWARMAVDADGTVVACIPRNEFELSWFSPDGAVKQTATLPFKAWKRNQLAHDRMEGILERQARHVPGGAVPGVAPTEPLVVDMLVRDNGDVWCMTSQSMWNAKEGIFVAYDVVDKNGQYTQRVEVVCEGDPTRDRLLISGDRAYLVTGYWDAVYRVQGADVDENARPMSITCFEIK